MTIMPFTAYRAPLFPYDVVYLRDHKPARNVDLNEIEVDGNTEL